MSQSWSDLDFKAGEQWCYRAPGGLESSRIVVGALVSFAGSPPIACCAVTGAGRRLPDGGEDRATIPFLPMTAAALAQTVTRRDGTASPPAGFLEAFEDWRGDPRGLSAFTVPFEGYLDIMIARQMAEIVGVGTGESEAGT